MSEGAGEKTEEPTEHRLEESRKKGQVPQRKNAIEAVFFLTTTLILLQASPEFARRLLVVMDASLDSIPQNFQRGLQNSSAAAYGILEVFIAILGGFVLVTVLFGLTLNKFNFSAESIAPKFEKLNPVSGLKQIFSMQTIYNFGRLLCFFVPVALALYALIAFNLETMLNASQCGWTCVAAVFLRMFFILLMVFALLHIVLGALDFKLQDVLFRRQNKMTKDDVKREYKQNEGDPLIKGARKSLARADAMLPDLKHATHVVVGGNIIIALIHYPGRGSAPYMLFKHRGTRVAEYAAMFKGYKCPIVNLPNQAQRLFSAAAVGTYLPIRTSKDIMRIVQATQG